MAKSTKLIVLLLLVVGGLFYYVEHFRSKPTPPKATVSFNSETVELTLLEALNMGLTEVEQWDSNVGLVDISSVDDNFNSTNGKRRKWSMYLASFNSTNNLVITIEDRKITNKVTNNNKLNRDIIIDIKDIKLDSTDALQAAIKVHDLRPAVTWARGYHYFLAKDTDGNNIITVSADNKKGNFTKVFIDSKTKKMLGAIEKVYTGGGFFKVENDRAFGLTEESQSIIGHSLSPNYNKDNTLIIWGYGMGKKINTGPIIKMSNNKGVDWTNLHVNIEIVNGVIFSPNFSENKIIYLFNEKKIYQYSIETKKLTEVFSNTNIRYVRLFENKLVALTESDIYTVDFHGNSVIEQQLTADSIFSIKSYDNKLFVFTSNGIFEKKEKKWVNLDPSSQSVDGIVLENKIYTFSDTTLFYFEKGNKGRLSYTFSEPISTILTSPNNKTIYVITAKGIHELIEGRGTISAKEIYKLSTGYITSLSNPANDFYFISVGPESKWINLK